MKKIALLLTILCASSLYGMKRSADEHYVEPDMENMGGLSPEVQVMIIQALNNTYDKNLSPEENLTNMVNAIKGISITNQQLNAVVNYMYGNLEAFTKLVHILADKFGVPTSVVAEKFGTPVAKKYNELGHQLIFGIENYLPIGCLDVFIKNGADVNYSKPLIHDFNQGGYGLPRLPSEETPMLYAMKYSNFKAIVLLLDSGVKLESDEYYDANNYWPIPWAPRGQAMKRFIDNERAKQSMRESL